MSETAVRFDLLHSSPQQAKRAAETETMGLTIVRAPSFPDLEEELLGRLRMLVRQDPWTPIWLSTPTSTLASHLRSRLGRTAIHGAITAVRVAPISILTALMSRLALGRDAPRWSSALTLALREDLARLPEDSALAPLRDLPAGAELLVPTFLDLGDAGFGIEQLDFLLEIADEPDTTPLARETLRLYSRWVVSVTRLGLDWQPFLQAALVEWIRGAEISDLAGVLGAEADSSVRILVFGFYDFTDLNIELLTAMAARIAVEVYAPGQVEPCKHPVFSFSNRVIEEFQLRKSSTRIRDLPTSNGAASFLLESFPEGVLGRRPEWLTFQHASGVAAEVLSAAVRILAWLSENPDCSYQDILVAAPDPRLYFGDLERVFSEFEIPLAWGELDIAEEGRSRPLVLLKRIWDGDTSLECLLFYLREYPTICLRYEIDLGAFEERLRSLKLVSSWSWARLLQLLESDPRLFGDSEVEFTAEERLLIRDFVAFFVDLPGQEKEVGLETALGFLKGLQGWLPDSTLLDSTIQGFEAYSGAATGFAVKLDAVFHMVLHETGKDLYSNGKEGDSVLIAPLMRARGVTRRFLVLLGLSADRFPTRIEEDPLLSDLARSRMVEKAGTLGHRLPVKAASQEEMLLLFYLVNSSAECVHWVIPDTDEHGKAVAPAPWLVRFLHVWDQSAPHALLERRIPRGPSQQAIWLYDLDPLTGRFLPPGFRHFLPEAPLFGGAAEQLIANRFARSETSACFHGLVPAASLVSVSQEPARLSVTRLEDLAKCPFRFWARSIARVVSLEPVVWDGDLDPREKGRLLHEALERIGTYCRHHGIPLSRLKSAGYDLAAMQPEGPLRLLLELLPPLFQKAACKDVERLVARYLQGIESGACGDGMPMITERRVRQPAPQRPGLVLSGVLDRIDRREAGDFVVLDYKSGRSPFRPRNLDIPAMKLGFHLQPFLYPWLCARELGIAMPSFRFLYLGDDLPREVEFDFDEAATEAVLELILQDVEHGVFPPLSSEVYSLLGLEGLESCAWCEFASLCRRFDRDFERRVIDLSSGLIPRRLAQIRKVTDECTDDH